MAEHREKSGAVLLRFQGKTRKLELFPAEAWPEEPAAEAGTFRVRAGGRWLGPDKYTFYSPDGLARLLTGEIAAALGREAADAPPRPDLPRGSRVRVWHGEVVEGMPTQSCLATTCTEPVQLLDGRWRVVVALYGQGMVHVPCEHVERVR